MSVEQNKDTRAVIRLIELTNNGEAVWRSIAKPQTFVDSDDTKFGTVFLGEYDDFTLRIFSWNARSLQMKTNFGGLLGRVPGSDSLYEYVWHRKAALQIVDKDGQLLWNFPDSSVVSDLYEAVRTQASGVSRLISKLVDNA